MITFKVFGNPPSKSNRYRVGRRGLYKSKEVAAYEQSFASQTIKTNKYAFVIDDRLSVKIDWVAPHYRSDIDGILKVILDCMQSAGIIYNDNKIDFLQVKRLGIDNRNPYVIISVEKLND